MAEHTTALAWVITHTGPQGTHYLHSPPTGAASWHMRLIEATHYAGPTGRQRALELVRILRAATGQNLGVAPTPYIAAAPRPEPRRGRHRYAAARARVKARRLRRSYSPVGARNGTA